MPAMGWAYHELKSFSADKSSMEVECGRSSGTGAGTFVFLTKEAREVLRVLQHHIEKQLMGRGRGSDGGAQTIPQPSDDCAPLKPKCLSDSPPPFKKPHLLHVKPVVENDYATGQDVQSMYPDASLQPCPPTPPHPFPRSPTLTPPLLLSLKPSIPRSMQLA